MAYTVTITLPVDACDVDDARDAVVRLVAEWARRPATSVRTRDIEAWILKYGTVTVTAAQPAPRRREG